VVARDVPPMQQITLELNTSFSGSPKINSHRVHARPGLPGSGISG
jgi:hypothetical protein